MATTISVHNLNSEATRSELMATQQQLKTLKCEHQKHAKILTATKEELHTCHLTTHNTTLDTSKSEDRMPHASGNNTQVDIFGLYSMVEGAINPIEIQERAITALRQELMCTRHECDELQVTLERMIESPSAFEEEILTLAYTPRTSTLPSTAICQQLTTNIPPFTTIMQYYHAMKGLNLIISQVPLLKPRFPNHNQNRFGPEQTLSPETQSHSCGSHVILKCLHGLCRWSQGRRLSMWGDLCSAP